MDLEILRRTPLFANLDDAAFALLTDDIQEIDLSRNAVLFYEGDQDDQLFAVLSGKVKLGRTAADGRENMVAIMGPGDVFGEMALFDPSPRSTNAVAVSETRLAAIKHESFKRAQQLDPTISDQVIKTLARRLRHANEALADLVFSDVPGRLAKALLDLADRFGRPAGRDGTAGWRIPRDREQGSCRVRFSRLDPSGGTRSCHSGPAPPAPAFPLRSL